MFNTAVDSGDDGGKSMTIREADIDALTPYSGSLIPCPEHAAINRVSNHKHSILPSVTQSSLAPSLSPLHRQQQ